MFDEKVDQDSWFLPGSPTLASLYTAQGSVNGLSTPQSLNPFFQPTGGFRQAKESIRWTLAIVLGCFLVHLYKYGQHDVTR
jgi:hypothetical protein